MTQHQTRTTLRRIRAWFFAAGMVVAVALVSLVLVLRLLVYWNLRGLTPEAHRIFHHVVQARTGIPAEWRTVAPYTSDTIALLKHNVDLQAAERQLSQASGYDHDMIWKIKLAVDTFKESGLLPEDVITSLTICEQRFGSQFAAVRELIARPDFESDILAYPCTDNDSDLSAIGSMLIFRSSLHYCAMMIRDVDSATSSVLADYGHLRVATARSVCYGHDHPVRNALTLLPAMVRWSDDVQLGKDVLAQLEKIPPIDADPSRATKERIVYDWTFAYDIAQLREFGRAGYPVDLEAPRSGLEVWQETLRVASDFERWARANVPAGDVRRNYRLGPTTSGIVPLPNNFLGFLARRQWGLFSDYARELLLIREGSMWWAFGHTFPFGNSTVAKLNTPPLNRLRVAYDLARLNLAAFLYWKAHAKWPTGVQDVLQYLDTPPRDPGARGPFIWDVTTNQFKLTTPPDDTGGIV